MLFLCKKFAIYKKSFILHTQTNAKIMTETKNFDWQLKNEPINGQVYAEVGIISKESKMIAKVFQTQNPENLRTAQLMADAEKLHRALRNVFIAYDKGMHLSTHNYDYITGLIKKHER